MVDDWLVVWTVPAVHCNRKWTGCWVGSTPVTGSGQRHLPGRVNVTYRVRPMSLTGSGQCHLLGRVNVTYWVGSTITNESTSVQRHFTFCSVQGKLLSIVMDESRGHFTVKIQGARRHGFTPSGPTTKLTRKNVASRGTPQYRYIYNSDGRMSMTQLLTETEHYTARCHDVIDGT